MLRRNYMSPRRRPGAGLPRITLIIVVLSVLSISLFIYNTLWSNDEHHVKNAISEFYEFEQAGDYGSAWELFHSQMKEKYTKDQYIQLRARVYMEQLGAQSFQFELGDAEDIGTWSMSENSPALTEVYHVPVKQHLLSVFGELMLEQQVYAVNENGEWRLLWSYEELPQ
jgi:hypothetical protein